MYSFNESIIRQASRGGGTFPMRGQTLIEHPQKCVMCKACIVKLSTILDQYGDVTPFFPKFTAHPKKCIIKEKSLSRGRIRTGSYLRCLVEVLSRSSSGMEHSYNYLTSVLFKTACDNIKYGRRSAALLTRGIRAV